MKRDRREKARLRSSPLSQAKRKQAQRQKVARRRRAAAKKEKA